MQFVNPEDLPPEVVDAIRATFDRQIMSRDVQIHDIKNLFQELTKEQLRILRHLLHVSSEHDSSQFYQGQITAILEMKFGDCACGSDHADPLQVPLPVVTSQDGSTYQTMDQFVNGEPGQSTPEDEPDEVGPPVRSKKEIDELMYLYGIEWAPVTVDSDEKPFMQCKGCGTPVFSLEDRMLREPGVKGCSPCQQQTKWG